MVPILAPKINGIAWCKVIKFDSANICKIAMNTLEDWSVKVIKEPTIILRINEEDTLWM